MIKTRGRQTIHDRAQGDRIRSIQVAPCRMMRTLELRYALANGLLDRRAYLDYKFTLFGAGKLEGSMERDDYLCVRTAEREFLGGVSFAASR